MKCNLAGRSAVAAKEIKDLITDSVAKVEEGSRLVDHSGDTLDEIMNSVKKVSDIVAEISQASTDQSRGIEQMNQAVSQMDEMTQQNAALVEEAAAASESLNDQASNLNTLIAFFGSVGQAGFSAPSQASLPAGSFTATSSTLSGLAATSGNSDAPVAAQPSVAKAKMISTPTYSGPERRKSERPWGDSPAKTAVARGPVGRKPSLDFGSARTKHRNWTTRLESVLLGRESLSAEDVGNTHLCDLGKWLDGEGQSKYGHLATMSELTSEHTQFHRCCAEVLELNSKDDKSAAKAKLKEVRTRSEQLVSLLTSIEKEADSSASTVATSAAPNVTQMEFKAPPVENKGASESFTAMPDSDTDWEEF